MRKRFSELFEVQGGAISPKVPVNINGVGMGPGVSFGGGVLFGGVDLTKFIGKDFEVELQNGVYVVKGVYD